MSESDVSRERQSGGSDGAPSVVAPPAQRPITAPGVASVTQSPAAERAGGAAPATAGAAGTTPNGGVNTLRAILLGGPSRTPDDARLTAIERRLDTLSLQLAREPRVPTSSTSPATAPLAVAPALSPEQEARLAELEQRLEAQGARLDAAGEAARGGDVTLGTLADLQQQVETLRQEHAQMAEQTATRLREADERCRTRQLRTRTARRQELQRLRRWAYAPAGSLPGTARPEPEVKPDGMPGGVSAKAVNVAPAPVWPVAPESRPLTVAVAGATAGSSALVAHAVTLPAHPVVDERDQHAAIRRELDMGGAWRVLGHSLTALFHALATVVLVLGRLAGNDLRAAWRALVGLVRGRREDDEDFDARHDQYRH